MRSRTKEKLGAAAVGAAGLFIAKESVSWALGRLWDAFLSLFGGEHPSFTIPHPFPWANVTGLTLLVVGALLFLHSLRDRRAFGHAITSNADSVQSTSEAHA